MNRKRSGGLAAIIATGFLAADVLSTTEIAFYTAIGLLCLFLGGGGLYVRRIESTKT